MNRVFFTYFDHHYLPRGIVLYHSLREHCPNFELWVLCLSDECHEVLIRLSLPGLKTITLNELEQFEPNLIIAKKNRTRIEYFFTCTPVLALFVLTRVSELVQVTYLDSDVLVLHSLDALWAEIGDSSIAITPHRFPAEHRDSERYGLFNVGLITFRRDLSAYSCLEWWRDQCLEWCYDRLDGDRFADQKYLDKWPDKFSGVKIITNPGVNLAPWNLASYHLDFHGNCIFVAGHEILIFHFHGLKQISEAIFDPQLVRYSVKPDSVLVDRLYKPYLNRLNLVARKCGIRKKVIGCNPRVEENVIIQVGLYSFLQRWQFHDENLVRLNRGELISGPCVERMLEWQDFSGSRPIIL